MLPAVRTCSAASSQPRVTTARAGVVGSLRSITSRRRAASAPTSAGPAPAGPAAGREGGPEFGLIGRVQAVKGRSGQPVWGHWGGSFYAGGRHRLDRPTCSIACRAGDGVALRGLLATIGRRWGWAGLDERLDVGEGGGLAGQTDMEGVGRRQQAGAVSLPQRAGHQLLGAGAGREGLCGPGDGFVVGLAGVVVVDEVGHAAKWLGSWRDVVGHGARPPRPWDGRDRMLVGQPACVPGRDGGSWLDRCWGARGRPSIPWPGSAPGQRQKQPTFSGCFGQAVRGWGAFGRPRLQERHGTRDRYDTMPPAIATDCPAW